MRLVIRVRVPIYSLIKHAVSFVKTMTKAIYVLDDDEEEEENNWTFWLVAYSPAI